MSDDINIVIVEDDVLIAEDLKAICEDFGANVVCMIHRTDGAVEKIKDVKPDYVLMDVRLDGKRDGVEIAQEIQRYDSSIKLVFVTGSNEPPTIERINADPHHGILIKPIHPSDLREALGM